MDTGPRTKPLMRPLVLHMVSALDVFKRLSRKLWKAIESLGVFDQYFFQQSGIRRDF